MPWSRLTWCAALAAGCVLAAPAARAADEEHAQETEPSVRSPWVWRAQKAGWVPGNTFAADHRRHRARPPRVEPEEETSQRMLRLGVEGQSARHGGSVDLRFALEDERWGISSRLGMLSLSGEDNPVVRDRLHVVDAHVTYSLAATARARLRFETGIAAMRRPEATYVGPSLAMSFERCILGALDMEGRLQWVPLPHTALDGQIGFGLHLGALTLRAGWRGLLLDDHGRVTGTEHVRGIGGLFGGVGLSL